MRRFFWILPALLAGVVPNRTLVAQDGIARVKSHPGDYRERVVRLRGDVVEVRGVTPLATQGLYRLIDASDPAGILVRTMELPTTSGPFEIQARLAPEFGPDTPLLDEVRRREPLRWGLILPGVVAVIGLAGMLTVLFRYLRARRTERLYQLGPPIWLIPTSPEDSGPRATTSPRAEAPAPAGYQFQYAKQEELQGQTLAIESRRLGYRLVLVSLLATAGTGWYLVTRASAAERPVFALLVGESATDLLVAAPPVENDDPDELALADDSTPAEDPPDPEPRRDPEPPVRRPRPTIPTPPPAPDRDARPARDRANSEARRRPQPTLPAESTVAIIPAPQAVQLRPPPPPPPPPPPAPSPAPPPSPVSVPPARPESAATVLDPDEERAAARAALEQGARRFAAALAALRLNEVRTLYPEGGMAEWRRKFLDYLADAKPESELGWVGDASRTDEGAQTTFMVSFRWRGNFGLSRRKEVRFAAEVRGSGSNWEWVGVRLLEEFP